MQAVISSWLNLEKIIFKPGNETIYSTNITCEFKTCGVLCSRNEKILLLRKMTGSTNGSAQKEGKRENKILLNNL